MVYRHKVIDKLEDINVSEDFVDHIKNVNIEDSRITERTFEEYREGGLDKIGKRVPESAYEVYLRVGAPFASMNKHFRNHSDVKRLTDIYDNEVDVKEYARQVKEYPNDYYVIVKDPSRWDVFEQAFNDYPVEGECFKKNCCGVFRFENFDYDEKENLASWFEGYINDSIGDSTTKRMAKKGKENFEGASIYKIESGSIKEV